MFFTYKFITIASLVAVRNRPELFMRQGGATPDFPAVFEFEPFRSLILLSQLQILQDGIVPNHLIASNSNF